MYMKLQVGDKAPDFEVYDDQENKISLKNLRGKKIILYFYPKDDTPGCTREACSFRDNLDSFKKKYVGINRVTFLIDAEGKIEKIWQNVKVEGHAEELLGAIPNGLQDAGLQGI